MSDFTIHRLLRGETRIQSIGKPCADWVAVREAFENRQRSENEQFIVMHQGLIYAIERADGNGFAMVHQDRQSTEDLHWYPKADQSNEQR